MMMSLVLTSLTVGLANSSCSWEESGIESVTTKRIVLAMEYAKQMKPVSALTSLLMETFVKGKRIGGSTISEILSSNLKQMKRNRQED